MDAGVAPLLLGGTGPMASAPSSEAAVIGLLDVFQRDARGRGLLFKGSRIRKLLVPLLRIRGRLRFDTLICCESDVGHGILPGHGAETRDLLFALGLLFCTEA